MAFAALPLYDPTPEDLQRELAAILEDVAPTSSSAAASSARYQAVNFAKDYAQLEPLSPEQDRLFPDGPTTGTDEDFGDKVDSDHSYAAKANAERPDSTSSSGYSSSDSAIAMDCANPALVSGNRDPVLSAAAQEQDQILSSIDAPAPTGLGIDLPEFDLDMLMEDVQSNEEASAVDEEDAIVYDVDDDDEQEEKEDVDVNDNDIEEIDITKEKSEDGKTEIVHMVAAPATKDLVVVKKEVSSEDESSSVAAARSSGRQRRTRRRKPKANVWSRDVGPKVSAAVGSRPKLYEQAPFADPELERCRLNALCAKQNRDKKRAERQKIDAEVTTLRSENIKLKKQAESSAKRLRTAEEQLHRLKEMLRTHRLEGLMDMVKCDHPNTARARASCRACSLGKRAAAAVSTAPNKRR